MSVICQPWGFVTRHDTLCNIINTVFNIINIINAHALSCNMLASGRLEDSQWACWATC
jgi:hypothetical protein